MRPQNLQRNVSPLEQLHDPRPRRREKQQVNEEEVRDVVGLHLRFGNLCGRRGAVEEIQVTVHSLDHEVERPTPSVSQRQWACRWHGSTARKQVPYFSAATQAWKPIALVVPVATVHCPTKFGIEAAHVEMCA